MLPRSVRDGVMADPRCFSLIIMLSVFVPRCHVGTFLMLWPAAGFRSLRERLFCRCASAPVLRDRCFSYLDDVVVVGSTPHVSGTLWDLISQARGLQLPTSDS